jgi:AraC family transcriptional regulator
MQNSRIQVISCETGEATGFSPLEVDVESGDRWSGVRVQTMLGHGAGELAESYLPRHVLTIGSSRRLSAKWVEGPRVESPKPSARDQVCIFPAMQPYRAAWDTRGRSIFVELSPDLLDEATRHVGRDGRTVLRAGLAVDDHFIPPLAEALVDLAARKEPATRLLAESLGLTLATHLAQAHAESGQQAVKPCGPIAPEKLRMLNDFIDANLDSPISLGDLAGQVEMSVFHFARSFRQTTGVAPYQFVMRRRIELAREQLRQSDASVAEVALQCGFSQQSHFSEAFRRIVGVSPRDYRAALGIQRSSSARTR